MSTVAQIETVFEAYNAGEFALCLSRLEPLLATEMPLPELLLIAAQSYAQLNHLLQAAHFYKRAADVMPDNAPVLLTIAASLKSRMNWDGEAIALLRRAEGYGPLGPQALQLLRLLLRTRLELEDVARRDESLHQRMLAGDLEAFAADDPFFHLMWCASEALHAQVRNILSGNPYTEESRARRRAEPHEFGKKIRVGYLSSDVSDQHATMILLQGVLAMHDPERFDVTLFCFTDEGIVSTDKEFRKRYGNIVSIRDLDDAAARQLIRSKGIDILVDLKGHSRNVRVDLINSGLAPVHVAYLGFPGSATGIDCDYIIGDHIVLQDGSQSFYHEQFCRLPDCYQANDSWTRPLPEASLRTTLGLPEDKFIFASFNDVRKITAKVAASWAEILRQTSDSLLWMLCRDPKAQGNFSQFMAGQGIETDRIVYMDRTDYASHIARIQAADLALDTFPYCGHTTTSDQLWAGLPGVSLKGQNFASRVSESLLRALGVSELVAEDADGFVELAVSLAKDPGRLAAIRETIATNRFRAPLFDTERFTRHLECAYEMMVKRAKAGLPPQAFDVPALPPRMTSFK